MVPMRLVVVVVAMLRNRVQEMKQQQQHHHHRHRGEITSHDRRNIDCNGKNEANSADDVPGKTNCHLYIPRRQDRLSGSSGRFLLVGIDASGWK
jgi:hypothetical protein